ncbi:insulinase family protein [Alphaproteobacteria bacterium KMM 3653]|uniref:Insulinase family protein n=1 Tax=Harenicola maris TaxID=2841044 RepID=A0AAP2G4I5_9RHOB|nr:insulinase family protein [Harenicola maris]
MIRKLGLALTFICAAGIAQAEVQIEEITSPGGIDAWMVQEDSIPFTALEIRFEGGASLDAEGKRGATALMTYTLEEGAGEMDARAFAVRTEELAASFRFDIGQDQLSISARFLTENRDEAVALLHAALTETRFDDADIDRVRGQMLSSLASDAKDPDTIAGRVFSEAAFAGHPYASNSDGTEESLNALTREDLIAARDGVIAKDRLFVGAVGDINAEELGEMLDTLFDGIPEVGAPDPGRVDYALEGGITVVPFDTPQSVVSFAQPGITRHDPDFFPAFLLVEIMGGSGFNSRLMQEVREKRGLTYGIGAYLAPMNYSEFLGGYVSTDNARVSQTIDVVKAEWERLATEGVTQEELDRVKTYMTGSYPLRFDGNAQIARIMVGMQMEGLPLDYIATRNDKVNAVTLEEVNALAKELIQPDRLHFVVVGQPEGLESTN